MMPRTDRLLLVNVMLGQFITGLSCSAGSATSTGDT